MHLGLCGAEALVRAVFQTPFALALKRGPDAPFFEASVREKQQACATTTSRLNNDSASTVVALVDLAQLKTHRYHRADTQPTTPLPLWHDCTVS